MSRPTDVEPGPRIREVVPGSLIFEVESALPEMYCNHIIDRFESHADEQYPRRVGQMVLESSDVKRSTDLVVSGKPH
tara:strand:- start:3206 stop:3436 length:231 start_codon:yes stop_codon:yes gene_type:complete